MKQIQFRTDLIASDFFGGPPDPNQPRLLAYLCGLNEFANNFLSHNFGPVLNLLGQEVLVSPSSTLVTQLDPIPVVFQPPGPVFGTGRPWITNYVFSLPVLGASTVAVTPNNSFSRSVYQYFQQFAELKPRLKKVKVQLYNHIPGFGNLLENLGKLYIGRMEDPLLGNNPLADTINLRDYYKPSAYNSGLSDPQAYLQAVGTGVFTQLLPYIEIDVPLDLVLDGNTVMAINVPVQVISQVSQLVTLYFE